MTKVRDADGRVEADAQPRQHVSGHPAAPTVFLVGLGLTISIWLWATSNPGSPVFPALLAMLALAAMGGWWLVMLVKALRRRQRPGLVVLVTPLVALPLLLLGLTDVPTTVRWRLSEPDFDAVIERTGEPVVRSADPDDDEAGWSDLGPCPKIIGSYVIDGCSRFPGGYLFWDSVGSGLIDDGGVAYLPAGVPSDAGTGWFESPQFTHLHGPWYAFESSW